MSDRKGMIAWFAGNHVAANLLMVLLLAAGIISLFSVVIEVFPEFDTDVITVQVPYLGASPEEAEEGVCVLVEEEIASIEGIERIRSTATEGMGSVTIELDEDADDNEVLDDVKAAVDRIDTFPAETEKPVVSLAETRRQVITVVLYGDVSERTLKELAERVRDDLNDLDEISQAEVSGIRPYEISIEVSEDTLQRYGLTLAEVANVIRRTSLDLPGGSVKTDGGEILLRTKGKLYRGDEFESIVVRTQPDGTQILLGDIAEVIDGFADTDTATRFDGQRGALVQVSRVGNEGALDVANATKAYVSQLETQLPAGVEVATWDDESIILRQRISLLLRNAALGLVLVFACLALFLDLRLAFWTTLGIPISFLGGLWLIPYGDVTINMISLFAFIVVLGIVVDDAIVVGENIFECLQNGMRPLEAAIHGAREMAVPVTFAIITSVAAFAPLLFVTGNMGKVMRNIPVVVITVLLMSLVEALLILPAHLSGEASRVYHWFKPVIRPIDQLQARVRSALRWVIEGPYRSTLEWALAWRYAAVAIAIATLLVMTGVVAGGFVEFTFFPKVDADNMIATLTMPQGTPVEQTKAVVAHLEAAAMKVAQDFDDAHDGPPLIRHVSTTIGQHPSLTARGPRSISASTGSSAHLGEVNVELLSSEERTVPSPQILARWRKLVGEVPGAASLTFSSSLFSAGDAVSVQLSHRDFDTLLRAADQLQEEIASYPGTSDVADSFLPGKEELTLTLTPAGRTLGLTLSDLAQQVRAGFYGEEAQRIQRGRDEIRVMVRYPEAERQSLGNIDDRRVRLADGSEVPLSTVATITRGRGYASINRVDRRRVVTVTADVDESVADANAINQDLRATVLPLLTRSFPGLTFDFEGEQREQSESLGSLVRNFIFAQLAIYGLLAIPFRSYVQPVIVMSAIPFGLVGAVGGHLVMGMDLSILSLFGMVALTGVVVNDSLIMIDLINRERAAGVPMEQAIRDSGLRRFRPILLTTATTFLGLTPMLLEPSYQARFLIPMATSLAFGIVFATAITLILVPVLYRILEDVLGIFGIHAVARRDEPADGASHLTPMKQRA